MLRSAQLQYNIELGWYGAMQYDMVEYSMAWHRTELHLLHYSTLHGVALYWMAVNYSVFATISTIRSKGKKNMGKHLFIVLKT